MSMLKNKLAEIFPQQKAEIAEFGKAHGDKIVSEVTLIKVLFAILRKFPPTKDSLFAVSN